LQHLRMVLDTLRQCHLFAKESKCVFGAKEISYLGHVISGQGVTMDTTKVEVVQSWPQPKTVHGLRGFLGLAGYYQRFIVNFGVIAHPLTQLLKKEGFTWTTTATKAFDVLKKSLTTTPVLQLPDFDKSFIMDCDASGSGFGVVLHQQDGPIAFYSRAIAPQHAKLAAYERELIGLVQAVRH
jgi:hypothetical protein